MRLRLVVTDSPGRLRKVLVEPGQILKIGRTEQADLAFPEDMMLSRLHFAIECAETVCRIRDLGSTNGTHLNGRRVGTSSPLKNGDEIQAGQTTFRVRIEATDTNGAITTSTSLGAAALAASPSTGHGQTPELVEPAAQAPGQAPAEPPGVEVDRQLLDTVPASSSRIAAKPARIPVAVPRPASVPGPSVLVPDRFVTATMLWEDLKGTPKLTVIIKCTCDMTGRGSPAPVAAKQLPIFKSDVPGGDEAPDSIRFESDMVPYKPKADVVLVGKAHSPRANPSELPLDVSLRVGTLEKTIRVFGDRTWWFPTKLALMPEFSKPEPFKTMDLVYERAFGGIDGAAALYCAENLVGRGFIGKRSPDSIHGKPLPNLEDPSSLIQSWNDRPKPVGFGFYGRGWMPRLKLVGTPHNPPDPQERVRGLPSDFSYAFFNGAHPDLQVEGYLKGNEEVELKNLSADSPVEFRLPGLRPRVTVARWTTPPTEWIDRQLGEGHSAPIDDVPTVEETVRTVLDTLVLIPDEGIFYLVFRGQLQLKSLEALEVARVSVAMDTAVGSQVRNTGVRTWIPRPDV